MGEMRLLPIKICMQCLHNVDDPIKGEYCTKHRRVIPEAWEIPGFCKLKKAKVKKCSLPK
jgi:hypothetical protein